MRIESDESPALPDDARKRIDEDIRQALTAISPTEDGRFVVNSTLWFKKSGSEKPKPCVMNAADYLSKTFQATLKSRGWTPEKELAGQPATAGQDAIEGQTIDAYIELQAVGRGFSLSRDNFLELFSRIWKDAEEEGKVPPFLEAYHGYIRRNIFPLPKWGEQHPTLFTPDAEARSYTLRVGAEFETGNIASSFRALAKLNLLYWLDYIDVGVFVTSKTKEEGAGRIWPVSNRNGSFEELRARHYERIVQLPLWEFSFAPDDYDDSAPYLARNRTLYRPRPLGRTIKHKDVEFEVYERELPGKDQPKKDEVLLPRKPNQADTLFGDEEPASEST